MRLFKGLWNPSHCLCERNTGLGTMSDDLLQGHATITLEKNEATPFKSGFGL